jgi:hypothetical protein
MRKYFLELFAHFILGAELWIHAQGVVRALDDQHTCIYAISEHAIRLLDQVGLGYQKWAINLSVSLAVAKSRGMAAK